MSTVLSVCLPIPNCCTFFTGLLLMKNVDNIHIMLLDRAEFNLLVRFNLFPSVQISRCKFRYWIISKHISTIKPIQNDVAAGIPLSPVWSSTCFLITCTFVLIIWKLGLILFHEVATDLREWVWSAVLSLAYWTFLSVYSVKLPQLHQKKSGFSAGI
jgi:hypothetical protein